MSKAGVGGLLRKARNKRGWPLREVASKLGVSIPYLSRVEQDKQTIRPILLRKLATVLELDTKATQRLFQLLGRLPPAVEARLLSVPDAWDIDPGLLVKGGKIVRKLW